MGIDDLYERELLTLKHVSMLVDTTIGTGIAIVGYRHYLLSGVQLSVMLSTSQYCNDVSCTFNRLVKESIS